MGQLVTLDIRLMEICVLHKGVISEGGSSYPTMNRTQARCSGSGQASWGPGKIGQHQQKSSMSGKKAELGAE